LCRGTSDTASAFMMRRGPSCYGQDFLESLFALGEKLAAL
jgi:hypothetical protein